jgi:hypothetical protein
MFFRRETPKMPLFQEQLQSLRDGGFTATTMPSGEVRVARGGIAALLREADGQARLAAPAGVEMGDETGSLVDGGYQKFFRTPSGRQKPATADELKALHDFEEDLAEALGLESLYNEALGTVSTYYLYDRVKDRDRGAPKRVWE